VIPQLPEIEMLQNPGRSQSPGLLATSRSVRERAIQSWLSGIQSTGVTSRS